MTLMLGQFWLAGTELTGDVPVGSIGRTDVSTGHVEILGLSFGTRVSAPRGSLRAGAHREIQPLRFVKPMDQTTPDFYRGCKQNQRMDGDIKIVETDPASGRMRHRFTLRVTQARIVTIESSAPGTGDGDAPRDTIELAWHTLAYIDEVHGVEFEDLWSDALSGSR